MVARLQLIKLLQREHWPLAKIRAHLETLDDDGVQRELRSPGSQLRRVSDSALSYVQRVLGEEPAARADAMARESLPGELPSKRRAPDRRAFSAPAPDGWPVTKSTWERIRLTRDIELNVRRPLTREQNRVVERLLDAARDILSEEDPV